MTRFTPIQPEAAEGQVASIYQNLQAAFGTVPNLFRITANSAETLEALTSLFGTLGKGKLNAQEREAIALAVAEANACNYCLSAHTALGKGAGLSDEQMNKARDGQADTPRLNAIVSFAKLLVKRGGRVSDEEVAHLRHVGLADSEILEIVGNVTLNIFTNYLNNMAETEIDFPVIQAKTFHHVS